MGFLPRTLFPDNRVSLIAVDERIKPDMKNRLQQLGLRFVEVPCSESLQPSISGHPDMQLLHIADNILICHPQLPANLFDQLRHFGFKMVPGNTVLKAAYPLDIAYNIAIVGKLAFHNMRHTDSVAAEFLKRFSIHLIHVNQGYAKCATLPITPESLITSDPSIARAACDNGLDVLFLPVQTKIRLPGLSYGFIGGTAGFIARKLIAFTGNLDTLDDAEDVKAFLEKYDVKWICLDENEVIDYGGLLPLYE
ncbi:MAG: hypothetical protein KBA53_13995 [Thermoclostridium sp.]|nr:hypothetical protein [Thermoclostridium sp.]